MDNNELYHYGVKGMKWGVRRRRDDAGSSTSRGRSGANNDKKKRIAKRVAIGVGVAAGAAIATYGAYKISKIVKNKKAVKAGASFVAKSMKSYAEMSPSEAREMRDRFVALAESKGFVPSSYKFGTNNANTGYLDLLRAGSVML